MRVPSIELLKSAYGRFALGAYNVSSMEQVHGLFQGAAKAQAPILVQFSRVMRKYAHPAMLEGMVKAAESIYPSVVFGVHLDHGDEATCEHAIESGNYSSVMIDASHHPFEENVAITRRVVERAHAREIMVEAELGLLHGIEDDMSISAKDAILTDPAQAEEFVAKTHCDSLAIAIGTSHGAYKFSGTQGLHFDRLVEIQNRLPGFPLVLHGASAVPKTEVDRINAAGGQLNDSASGVAADELSRAIEHGVTKVNIGTDGRLIWTRVHREFFNEKPKEFDFMQPGKIYMEEFAKFVAEKSAILKAVGQSEKTLEAECVS